MSGSRTTGGCAIWPTTFYEWSVGRARSAAGRTEARARGSARALPLRPPRLPTWVPLVIIVGAVVAADQATKEIVRKAFRAGEEVHVAGSLWVSPFHNPGVDGGGLEGRALPLALFGFIAILGIFGFLAHRHALRPIVLLGFGLLVGGGIGNLLDRLWVGSVSDFIVRGQTAFNLADVAKYAGGLIVFVALVAQLPRLLVRQAR